MVRLFSFQEKFQKRWVLTIKSFLIVVIALCSMPFSIDAKIKKITKASAQKGFVIVEPWDLEQYISGGKTPPKNLSILFKGASVAPDGSSWFNEIDKWLPVLDKEAKGLIKIKFYAGGVMGDEIDTIRKMRMNQLHLLGVTNMGLTKMIPELCVFELPFLFDYEPDIHFSGKRTQVDYILEKLEPTVARLAIKNGYHLGGFLEVGFDHFGSQVPITKADDIKKLKFWLFRGDRIREEINKAYGLSASPMELFDVAMNLSTGRIDSTFVQYMAAILLQWWPYIKYGTEYPLYGYESATIVFNGKVFDQIVPFVEKWGSMWGFKTGIDFKVKLLGLLDKACTGLRFIIRKDEYTSRQKIFREGLIKEVSMPRAELEKLKKKILPLYDKLADDKYPREKRNSE